MWAGEVEGFEWGELLGDVELGFEVLQHLRFIHPEVLQPLEAPLTHLDSP